MAETRVIHHIGDALAGELRRFLADAPAGYGACHEHDPGWLSVLRGAMGHKTMALVMRETADGPVVGYLPLALVSSRLFGRFLVSLPYLNRAGIVAADEAARVALLAEAVALADKLRVQYLELRHHEHTLSHSSISHNRDEKPRMVLELPPGAGVHPGAGVTDGLWDGYSAKVRNQVRKGDNAGLTIRFGGGQLLDDFYSVFSTNMRDLGTPVYPRCLFASILDTFGGNAELAVVRHENAPVAGALLVYGRSAGVEESQVPSASCLRSANHTNANMWMYHKMLQRAAGRGASRFDFGRSSPDSGTYRFKRQWGAQPVATTWQYYLRYGDVGAVRPDNPKYQRRIAAWQKLPVWVTRLVGPRIVRGIP